MSPPFRRPFQTLRRIRPTAVSVPANVRENRLPVRARIDTGPEDWLNLNKNPLKTGLKRESV